MSQTEQLPGQMDIFEHGRARNTDPSTSHEAASSVNATETELRILNVIAVCPMGITCGQLVDITNLPWNTLSPRLAPMREKGLIKAMLDADGNKVKRRWRRSRRNQLVWTVA